MKTPSDWDKPVFLMNFPISVSKKEPNNEWMRPDEQGPYKLDHAMHQWQELYSWLAHSSLVYILPGHDNLQDLPFVANLGCFLPHLGDAIIISNFTSQPRKFESEIGWEFFKIFDGYRLFQSPFCFEGEADLKWVRDNIYIGGWGSRSTREAFKWMRHVFDMEIIEIEMTDPKLYHLDCVFFPMTEKKAIVNVHAIKMPDLKKLGAVVDFVEVKPSYKYEGWTNVVRLGRSLLHAPGKLDWHPFAEVLKKHDFHLEIFDLTEFDKSGADLSCLCMHLNTKNRYG